MVWAKQVQLVLQAKGVWEHVTRHAVLPPNATENQSKVFKREEQLAMAEILLNIESQYVVSVISKRTSADIWKTLEEMNKSESIASQTSET